MTNLFTIGFTKKSAEKFFKHLISNGVTKVVDIRLGTTSQLAGFAKGKDLQYFLGLHGIAYEHNEMLAPTEELRKKYSDKKAKMTFEEYTEEFEKILEERKSIEDFVNGDINNVCLLCSEEEYKKCHRSIVANKSKQCMADIAIVKIIHL